MMCFVYRYKVIRHYHGHLSACYCIGLHPSIDVLCTGGRDATVRVGDMFIVFTAHLKHLISATFQL